MSLFAARKFQAGAVLFRPDETCEAFVLVRSGAIRVSLTAANGREIVLYRVRPGEVCLQTFSCLIGERRYSAEGVAETDLVLEIIPKAEFRRRVVEELAFREQMFAAIAHRFSDFERLVEDVALIGFEARLARALLRLADSSGQVRLTHEALASETGSARAVVSRQLGEFAHAGLVALARGRVELLDAETLAQIAEQDS